MNQRCFFSFLLLIFFGIPFAMAQEPYSVGLGGAYGLEHEAIGVNGRFYRNIGHHFCFGLETTAFFPETSHHEEFEETVTGTEFNLIAHYVFEIHRKIGIYPLFGFNYTQLNVELKASNDAIKEDRESAYGLNLGGGFHIMAGNVLPFLEYKFVASDLDDQIITAGIVVPFSFSNNESKQGHHAE